MRKSVRDTRHDLYRKSVKLRELAQDCSTVSRSFEVRDEQNKIYNKWKFYTNIIKEIEKKD